MVKYANFLNLHFQNKLGAIEYMRKAIITDDKYLEKDNELQHSIKPGKNSSVNQIL